MNLTNTELKTADTQLI